MFVLRALSFYTPFTDPKTMAFIDWVNYCLIFAVRNKYNHDTFQYPYLNNLWIFVFYRNTNCKNLDGGRGRNIGRRGRRGGQTEKNIVSLLQCTPAVTPSNHKSKIGKIKLTPLNTSQEMPQATGNQGIYNYRHNVHPPSPKSLTVPLM